MAAGRRVWDGLLQPGGSVEPHDLLCGLLKPKSLQHWEAGGVSPMTDEETIHRSLLSF